MNHDDFSPQNLSSPPEIPDWMKDIPDGLNDHHEQYDHDITHDINLNDFHLDEYDSVPQNTTPEITNFSDQLTINDTSPVVVDAPLTHGLVGANELESQPISIDDILAHHSYETEPVEQSPDIVPPNFDDIERTLRLTPDTLSKESHLCYYKGSGISREFNPDGVAFIKLVNKNGKEFEVQGNSLINHESLLPENVKEGDLISIVRERKLQYDADGNVRKNEKNEPIHKNFFEVKNYDYENRLLQEQFLAEQSEQVPHVENLMDSEPLNNDSIDDVPENFEDDETADIDDDEPKEKKFDKDGNEIEDDPKNPRKRKSNKVSVFSGIVTNYGMKHITTRDKNGDVVHKNVFHVGIKNPNGNFDVPAPELKSFFDGKDPSITKIGRGDFIELERKTNINNGRVNHKVNKHTPKHELQEKFKHDSNARKNKSDSSNSQSDNKGNSPAPTGGGGGGRSFLNFFNNKSTTASDVKENSDIDKHKDPDAPYDESEINQPVTPQNVTNNPVTSENPDSIIQSYVKPKINMGINPTLDKKVFDYYTNLPGKDGKKLMDKLNSFGYEADNLESSLLALEELKDKTDAISNQKKVQLEKTIQDLAHNQLSLAKNISSKFEKDDSLKSTPHYEEINEYIMQRQERSKELLEKKDLFSNINSDELSSKFSDSLAKMAESLKGLFSGKQSKLTV